MRHYYRFMELEPVMEQEEDSVGDGSPTSSMGSPSLSPPPDAWAQLSGKEYHDTLSNHLLQEHLDLQRAYRLLEVQYRNCDTRASRDHQRLKDVLPNQDRLRDELQRAKERETALRGEIYDLQEQNELLEFRILELEECHENASIRSVHPETRDVGTEMESGGVRDMGQTSLVVADQMDNDANRSQERSPDAPVSTFTSTTPSPTTRDRDDKLERSTAPEGNEDTARCQTLALGPSMSAHEPSTTQADSQTNPKQYTTEHHNACSNTPQEQSKNITSQEEITKEISRVESTHTETQTVNHTEQECNPFSTNTLTSLSESISCTLCRRLPRRRSFPGSSQLSLVDNLGVAEGENQKDSLRKSKSDGEIKARYPNPNETCKSFEADHHHNPIRNSEDKTRSVERERLNEDVVRDVANGSMIDSTDVSFYPNITVKHAGVQVDGVGGRGSAGMPSRRDRFSGSRVEEQVNTMRRMLNAIYDILRETRVEVECTNSELREEVQTLETTVQRLTEEVTRRESRCQVPIEGPTHEEPAGRPPLSGPPQVRRSRSLSFSKECYCCSQELRPTLEEVISKLQQVMDLVVDSDPAIADEPNEKDVNTKEVMYLEERRDAEEASKAMTSTKEMPVERVNILSANTEDNPVTSKGIRGDAPAAVQTVTNVEVAGAWEEIPKAGTQQEIKAKEIVMRIISDPTIVGDRTLIKETLDHRPKLHQDGWKPVQVDVVHDSIHRSNELQDTTAQLIQKRTTVKCTNETFVTRYVEDQAAVHHQEQYDSLAEAAEDDTFVKRELDPLPEEKTKPVLRRWREQLLVRRDRVQPWRIEMLDFPKRMPSVV